MSENRKIQLETEVVANTDGFQQIQQAAQQTAQVVQQAGEKASAGLDKISQGTKRAADSMARDSGRLTSEIKRVTLEMQSLGKTASEKFELKIAAKGLDAAQFAPMLAQLKEIERARAALAQQQVKDNFLGDLHGQIASLREQAHLQGLSADQALRYRAAQAGASAEAAQLITELTQIKAAQEAAAVAAVRQAQAQKEASAAARVRDNFVADVRGQIEALRLQSMTADEALRYKAAQAGASAETAHLVTQLSAMRAAQEAAAAAARKQAEAEKEAAAAARTRESFLGGLKSRADSIDNSGKARPESELLALRAAQLGVSKDAEAYIAKLRKVEAAHAAVGISARQTAFAMRQLPMQMTDVVTSLAGGMNPLMVLIQQGGQVKDSFGGVGNAIKAVTSLITPMTVAIAAGAVAVGGLGLAMAHVESVARDMNTLQAQLSATGRGDMFSTTELKQFVDEVSKAPGVTREAATQIVSELSKVKEIGPGLFKGLALSAADFAKATGTDAPTAARTLAEAFKDPEQGAKTLAKALDGLSSGQLQRIQDLAKEGDLLGAQRILYQQVESAVQGLATRGMTPLQESTTKLGNAWKDTMRELDNSQGLRNLNSLLAQTVGLVAALLEKGAKTGAIGNVIGAAGTAALGSLPGIGPALVAANSGANLLRGKSQFEGKGATGSWDAASGGTDRTRKEQEDALKRTLDAANGDRTQASALAELSQRRERYNKALADSVALHGKDSEAAKAEQKRLRDAVAAVDEQIAAKKKSMAGPASREGDQTRAAALEADLAHFRDKLQDERDTLAFHERQLQGQYQAGVVSLKEYYERRKQAIEDGARATVADLEKQKARLAEEVSATPKSDTSRVKQLEGKIDDATREQEKVRTRAGREVDLANDAMAESFRQLSDEVTAYRINLAELQGDEVTAARLRANQAIEQARRLAKKSEGSPSAISQEDQAATELAIRNAALLNEARRQTGIVSQATALEEERIAMAQRVGAISSIEALAQVGEVRKRAVAQMEEIVRKEEEIAALAENSDNWQLKLDTAQARQELEKLKEQMDPLAEHFRSLFTDATGDLFADLANNPKGAKDAIKRWASSITTELNREFGRDLATKVFGKEGIFGGLPGKFGEIFAKDGKKAPAPLVDTAPLSGSLNALKAAGVEPLTASFQRLQGVIEQVAANVGAVPAIAGPVTGSELPPPAGATTGDFSRFDRGQAPAAAGGQEQAQGALKTLASQGVDPASTALQKFTPAMEAATSALSNQGADVSLQRLASAAEAAANALQRIAGAQPGAAGAAGVPGVPGIPGAAGTAPSFGVVDTAPGGTRVQFPTLANDDQGNPMPLVEEQKQSIQQATIATDAFGEAIKMGMNACTSFGNAAINGGNALSMLPAIIQMIQAAAAASSAGSAAGGGGGFGGLLGSMFGKGGSAGGGVTPPNPFAMGMSQSVSTAGSFFLTPMSAGGYTGDAPPDQATGIVHGKEFVFSAPAVEALGVDTLRVLHEKARAGDGSAAVSTIARIAGVEAAGDTDRKPAAAKAVVPDVLHVLRDGGRDEVIRTITRIAEGKEPTAPGSSGSSALESDSTPAAIMRATPQVGSSEAVVSRAIARVAGMAEPAAPEVAGAAKIQAISRDVLEVIRRKAVEGSTETLLDRMPRYHTGGIVERVAEMAGAKLKPDEVPAILMGGPKGKREEVLTAHDPRHKDNLSPGMAKFFDRLPRYHEGGIVGEKSYMASSMNYLAPPQNSAASSTAGAVTNYTVQVVAGQGVTREQAMNQGRDIQRGMQIQAARRGRNN